MLVLVISTPHPSAPGDRADSRLRWRDWVAGLEQAGQVRAWYLRVGRGAAIVFDVPDNDTLHQRLTEWLTYVPAHFDVYPLVTPAVQEQLLRSLRDE
jgi:hypothetical protein